jgi:hypothetical protein
VAGASRGQRSSELDRLIEDFCAAADVAAERTSGIEKRSLGSTTSRTRPVASRFSLPAHRAVIGQPRRHRMGGGIATLFVKATVVGIAAGLLVFALVRSDLFRKPDPAPTEVSSHLAFGNAWRAAEDAAPVQVARPNGAGNRGVAAISRTGPALTAVSNRSEKPAAALPPAVSPLPEFKFSTWPTGTATQAQADTPAKRWDFLNSATGAIKTTPSKPVVTVPLPTRPDPQWRDQQRGDEKPLAEEKPINGEPDRNVTASGPPAGRDRARARRTVRRRTTRKFLLGRGAPPRQPGAQSTPAPRPSTEPPPRPRPRPALVPRADARTGHQLRLGQHPAPASDPSNDFLGFIKPTPRPDWARRLNER